MNNARIVFVAANASYSHTNLADWYLQAYTADLGYKWQSLEVIASEDVHSALNRLCELQPTVILASFYIFNRNFLLSLLGRYARLAPDCTMVGGGPEFLGDNCGFLTANPFMRAVVRGEGEIPLRAMLSCADPASAWPEIPGVCMFSDSAYIDNGSAKQIEDLDQIPSPFSAKFISAEGALSDFRKPFIQIETSRGCRNSCAFCTSANSMPVRYFSTARVRNDLKAIAAANITHVRVVDRTFNENRGRSIELLRMFREEFPSLSFHLEVDPAIAGEDFLGELKLGRPGNFHLDVGVQSLNQKALCNVARHCPADKTLAGLKALSSMESVEVHADLIAGLPGATLDDFYNDLELLTQLDPAELQLEILKILPGTRLQREQAGWNIESAHEPPYDVLRTATMPPEDIHTARWLCKLVDWFYAPKPLRITVVLANSTISGFWRELTRFCMDKPDLKTTPSLMNRFRLLYDFIGEDRPQLRHALQYAWLKEGFSPSCPVCRADPWKQTLPKDCRIVEGDPDIRFSRMVRIRLDHDYIFAYGPGKLRSAAAVFVASPEVDQINKAMGLLP